MSEHIVSMILISIFLVFLTSAIFYEIIAVTLKIIGRFHLRTRPLMFFLVSVIFFAHTVIVWVYAFFYWALVRWFDFHSLGGQTSDDFFNYVYFSAITYSSLGFGDIYPVGAIQFIASVEVLNGLILIGWSVMITYFAIQKLWDMHEFSKRKP